MLVRIASRRVLFLVLFMSFSVTELFALSPPDPLFNDIQGMSIASINFAGPGNDIQIALFIINSNSSTGFDVKFKLSNGGKFTTGTREIPMSALVLDKVSGTIGLGLTEPVNLDVLNNMIANEYTWNPGAAQTTETVNYVVELKASWNDPGFALAGFYFERIEAVISVGL